MCAYKYSNHDTRINLNKHFSVVMVTANEDQQDNKVWLRLQGNFSFRFPDADT